MNHLHCQRSYTEQWKCFPQLQQLLLVKKNVAHKQFLYSECLELSWFTIQQKPGFWKACKKSKTKPKWILKFCYLSVNVHRKNISWSSNLCRSASVFCINQDKKLKCFWKMKSSKNQYVWKYWSDFHFNQTSICYKKLYCYLFICFSQWNFATFFLNRKVFCCDFFH